MHHIQLARIAGLRQRRETRFFLRAAALALIVSLALPARAGDDRAVKLRVPPVYPEIAKRMRISGEVKLEATVDADGKVKDVKAVSGNHMLELAAEDAVRQWRFVPGDGDTVVTVAVNFALGQ
jgi:TonB family protein